MNFDQVLLQPEQHTLLEVVVEASRNVMKEDRQHFFVIRTISGDFIRHNGLGEPIKIYYGDVETLANEQMLSLTYGSKGNPLFDITPRGYSYYEYLKARTNNPVVQIETDMATYIDAPLFKSRYPIAHDKWRDAQQRLWSSESESELTTIGHLCREAMQEFADSLIEQHVPDFDSTDKALIVKRIKAIIALKKSQIGKTHTAFLDALLGFWGTVSDLVQRQEHGGQREEEQLKWEDARLVTFQTLVVMYEIDRAIQSV